MPGDFECLRCGFCCQLDVAITKDEMKRIRETGKTRFSRARAGEIFLKKRGKYCTFFEKGKTNSCKIYDARPDVCQRFPFKKDGSKTGKCVQVKNFHSEVDRKIVKFMLEEEAAEMRELLRT